MALLINSKKQFDIIADKYNREEFYRNARGDIDIGDTDCAGRL